MVDVHIDAFCLDVTKDVREQTKQKEEISYYNDNEHSNTLKYYYWLWDWEKSFTQLKMHTRFWYIV